jgi:hypothetical protein
MVRCMETKKITYFAKAKAEASLRTLILKNPDYNGRVFPCPCCQGWHIGRPRKNEHQNKYRRLANVTS